MPHGQVMKLSVQGQHRLLCSEVTARINTNSDGVTRSAASVSNGKSVHFSLVQVADSPPTQSSSHCPHVATHAMFMSTLHLVWAAIFSTICTAEVDGKTWPASWWICVVDEVNGN
jgi:hypothetical protein